jgi:hypothetical protein
MFRKLVNCPYPDPNVIPFSIFKTVLILPYHLKLVFQAVSLFPDSRPNAFLFISLVPRATPFSILYSPFSFDKTNSIWRESQMWNFPVRNILTYCRNTYSLLFERFIAKKVCTACSRTNKKIIPMNNLNKYLSNGKGDTKVNVNNNGETF